MYVLTSEPLFLVCHWKKLCIYFSIHYHKMIATLHALAFWSSNLQAEILNLQYYVKILFLLFKKVAKSHIFEKDDNKKVVASHLFFLIIWLASSAGHTLLSVSFNRHWI